MQGRILARTTDEPVVTLPAHGRHAQAVLFTCDGSYLLSCGQDAYVRLWKPPGFRAIGVFEGHTKSVNTLALSPDQTRLATGSSDGTVRVWSFPQGDVLHVLNKQATATFSPDGRQLATLSAKSEGSATLWDTETGVQVAHVSKLDTRVFCLAYSPDGRFLLVGGAGPIHRINLDNPSVVERLKGHWLCVAAMRISPDGKCLATTGGDDTLRLWSLETWREVNCMALEGKGAMQIAYEQGGSLLAVSTDHAIDLYSIADNRFIERIEAPAKGQYGLSFSPDGRYLACAAADGKVRIWATRLARRTEQKNGVIGRNGKSRLNRTDDVSVMVDDQ